MPHEPKFIDDVPVSRIFLGLSNPRHEPYDAEAKVIARLCEKENVYPLARDIVKHGLNPLERLALVPLANSRKGSGASISYYAAEGNRRLCALKLLNDPDLAPANLRKAFEVLAEEWSSPVTAIAGAVFDDIEGVNLWLERIHNGPQGGIGRKDWNAEQKQRFDGGSKNKAAQALLDYAEAEKMITPEERVGKLTTVQRFLGNDIFREVLGFDQGNPDDVGRTRPKAEFDILTKRFIRDLVERKHVNSRMNKEEIIRYARPLASVPGVTSTRIEPETLSLGAGAKGKSTRRKKPKKPARATHVRYEEQIFSALKSLGNEKLSSLYHSICSVDLDPHTPIVAIGTWSFFETLTACAGRNEGTSFDNFLSKNRLRNYGIDGDLSSMRDAMERIRAYGNTTKHHPISAIFNGDQLNNDMTALKTVILRCVEEAESKNA
jgi:hypothetical protein